MPLRCVLPFVPASAVATPLPHPSASWASQAETWGPCEVSTFLDAGFPHLHWAGQSLFISQTSNSSPLRVCPDRRLVFYTTSSIPVHTSVKAGSPRLHVFFLAVWRFLGQGHSASMVLSGIAFSMLTEIGVLNLLAEWHWTCYPSVHFTVCSSKCKLVLMIPSEQNFAKTK